MKRDIILSGKKASIGIVLREDLGTITSYMNDRSVRTFLRDPGKLFYIEEEEEWYQKIIKIKDLRVFAICEGEEFSGLVSLHDLSFRNGDAYIAYSIAREKWGRGLATEAVSLAVEYAFDYLNLRKLHSSVLEPNIASIKVLRKNGFKEMGRFQKNGYIPGNGYADEIYFELLNTRFHY
ncbi:MAG: GNAT family N-acetyltransferase [Thermoplasmataceae archaeon]